MHIFFHKDLKRETQEIELDEIQSKHAIRVLRLQEFDKIELINGRGVKSICEIMIPNKTRCKVKVLKTIFKEQKKYLTGIAISPTKNIDRIEWFCEKATEIGVDEIYFILTNNSERKYIKMERLEKIVIGALKQSKRLYKPKLFDLTPLKKINLEDKFQHILLAHCQNKKKHNLNKYAKQNTIIFIGPEGDFTTQEIEWALKNNWIPVSLGENRLRTETAGLVACTILNLNYAVEL